MSWIVLITPETLSEKLVPLKAAIPLVAESALALLIVMADPEPVELLIVSKPVMPSSVATPVPAPEQLPHCTSVAPESKQRPAAAGVAIPRVGPPWPNSTLATGTSAIPVPPLVTLSGD